MIPYKLINEKYLSVEYSAFATCKHPLYLVAILIGVSGILEDLTETLF